MSAAASTVTLRGRLRLAYAEQGDPTGPVLLLLPGITDSWRSYEPVLGRIPLSIRTIAVSQRGHGDSDKPATGYRTEDFAVDVVDLLDAMQIERAVLAGHSASCLVVRRVAIDRPDRVAGLVLEASPTTLRGQPGLESFVESTVSKLADPISLELARSMVADTSSDAIGQVLLDQLSSEVRKVPARVWRETFEALLRYDDFGEIGRIAAPTLLIWGNRDGMVGRAVQQQLASRIRRAELLVYEGVGHTPRWEAPSRFAADVTAFVARTTVAP